MAPPQPPSSSSGAGTMYGKHRQSTLPSASSSITSSTTNKQRQLSLLNSQLAQLHGHLSDLEDLVRMTAVQAEHIRALGGIHGALLMSAAKILGESGSAAGAGTGASGSASGSGSGIGIGIGIGTGTGAGSADAVSGGYESGEGI